ncbi:uncharacterized protein LOC110876923 [Helianthus annuus]|uniref:uncharacterized protein LOC110876923 n=1 Tax=Helianthus annuus TaxID=4232 RepID=UPI000B8FFE2C|nr:uncharacterized protein LOC110876923 [Helianthus annuus]
MGLEIQIGFRVALEESTPLRNFFNSKVGNGEKTTFWLDPWLSNEPLKDKFPEIFKLETDKKCKIADRLIVDGSGSNYVWAWRRPIQCGREVDELVGLCSLLYNFVPSSTQDSWIWSDGSGGNFSTGAVKRLLDCNRISDMIVDDYSCKWLPAKCNIFMWRASLNSIATAEALKIQNISLDDENCKLCSEGLETVEHIFTNCFVANLVWNHLSRWCKIAPLFFFEFKDLLYVHEHVGFSGLKKDILRGLIRIGCWCIWKARNEATFNNKEIKIEDIISNVKALGFLWSNSRLKGFSISWQDWCKFVIM